MSGKLLKSALIAPLAALLLMLAAPVPAQAANADRDGAFGHSGSGVDQQDRWQDRRAAAARQHVWRVGWRRDRWSHRRDDRRDRWSHRRDDRRDRWSHRRDDRRDRWSHRRDNRRDRWSDRRYRRHQWRQDRWWSRWNRWNRRAGSRRHRHPHRY